MPPFSSSLNSTTGTERTMTESPGDDRVVVAEALPGELVRLPHELAGGVEGVDVHVVAAEDDRVAGPGGGAADRAVGPELPHQLAIGDVQGVELAVPRADVDPVVGNERRRGEPAGAGAEGPDPLPRRGIDGPDGAARVRHEHEPVGRGRAVQDRPGGRVLPEDVAPLAIHRPERAAQRTHEDTATGDDGLDAGADRLVGELADPGHFPGAGRHVLREARPGRVVVDSWPVTGTDRDCTGNQQECRARRASQQR